MAVKLDLKDKKILWELNSNCRQSNSEIAKKVLLSPEAVLYRIKKLENEGIITQYQTIINLSKIGIIQFKLCLSLQYLNKEKLEQIINKLKKDEKVKWIVSTQGNWNLIISCETNSLDEVDDLKNSILSYFGKSIREKSLSILIEAETFERNYLLEEKKTSSKRTIMKESTPEKLDKFDLKLLKELSMNARMSIVDLSFKLKLTPRIVQYRIKQLEKKEIILGYKIAIDYEKTGIKFYKLFISLGNLDFEEIKKLNNYFISNKNVIHNVRVIGNWDFEPEVEVFNENEFNKILDELREKFSDLINKIDIITIRKEHKFVYF